MGDLSGTYTLIREGGFLALFVISAWLNWKQYKARNDLVAAHAKELKDLNDKTLASVKDFAVQVKEMNKTERENTIDMFDRMTEAITRMTTKNRGGQ